MIRLITFILAWTVCVFAYEPLSFKELPQPKNDYELKNWSNWENARRVLLQMQAYDDSHYVQWGDDTVDAAGYDTVYLDDKYIDSASWVVTGNRGNISSGATPFVFAVLSDSSFAVRAVQTGVAYYWQAVGVKKPSRN